jgi:hypothetical protein
MILTAWSTFHEAVKINASKRCTPLLQDVMAHTSVTSHCFWLTSRHAACSTRLVRKVTRGQAMSGHIIIIISVQQFLKNGNTFCRLLIQLPLNKLCLVMPNQVSSLSRLDSISWMAIEFSRVFCCLPVLFYFSHFPCFFILLHQSTYAYWQMHSSISGILWKKEFPTEEVVGQTIWIRRPFYK